MLLFEKDSANPTRLAYSLSNRATRFSAQHNNSRVLNCPAADFIPARFVGLAEASRILPKVDAAGCILRVVCGLPGLKPRPRAGSWGGAIAIGAQVIVTVRVLIPGKFDI